MEQRTLKIGDRIIYCYEDGSVEYQSKSTKNKGALVRTFGSPNGHGYRVIKLSINGILRPIMMHRLIAMAFHSNENNLPEVDHIDRNGMNNSKDNLRWCDRKTNANNRNVVDNSVAKYGVRKCKNLSGYNKAHNKAYRNSHFALNAIKPSGTGTTYYFESSEDPVYKQLKPLSQKERYFKYQELKPCTNQQQKK